jgi:murein DD-endopeptidase MepM/ murein hydrolase activator NlpD
LWAAARCQPRGNEDDVPTGRLTLQQDSLALPAHPLLLKDKGAPTNALLPAYLSSVTAYNGAGPQAAAYAQRVLADATASAIGNYTSTPGGCSAPGAPVSSGGYTNPFAAAHDLIPSRIDQGVDYSGSGPILALGPGRVYLASSTDTGWGNGNGFLAYTLTTGPYHGQGIYIAEGITPTVTAGQTITAGEQIATFNGHSIETGFAAGPASGDLALAHNIYTDGADTAAGRAMNELLLALGVPGGHRDLTSCNGPCPILDGPTPAPS